jgi:hypothetical protein
MRLTINSETTLQAAIGELRAMWRDRKYLTLTVKAGKGRSLDQNAISHAWYEQVARELREDDARGVKRYCKLHFGVPLLRAEDDEFREAYDGSILRTLSYEQKLLAMDVLPVTSRMTTAQLSRYMEDVQKHYRGRVSLEFPVEHARAA